MPTDMNHWKSLVRDEIKNIADEAYQRHEWFENVEKTWFFPEEMFCGFFDDAAAEDYFNRDDTGLNGDQLKAGKYLVELMKKLLADTPRPKGGIDPKVLINNPLMIECRSAANQYLSLFK